jgi:hypothetical protein
VSARRWLAALISTLSLAGASTQCSISNQEGPDVTCAELECGRLNACQEGIIAQCADGSTVQWRVCDVVDVCKEEWQVEGSYRCSEDDTDCEGCRPERTGCDDPELGGGGAGGGPASGGAPAFGGAPASGGGGSGGS